MRDALIREIQILHQAIFGRPSTRDHQGLTLVQLEVELDELHLEEREVFREEYY